MWPDFPTIPMSTGQSICWADRIAKLGAPRGANRLPQRSQGRAGQGGYSVHYMASPSEPEGMPCNGTGLVGEQNWEDKGRVCLHWAWGGGVDSV